jgi:opacity protein-like surface antigen
MKLVNRIVLVWMLFASAAWAQQIDVSGSYLYQGSNQAPGSGNWFGANGGRADISFGNWRSLAVVAEFAGARASDVNSSGYSQTTFTYMAGPRRTFGLGGSRDPRALARGAARDRQASAFAQFLIGGVHAADGLYPSGGTLKDSANAFSFSTGGGVEVNLNQRVSLRLIQADYLYTRLPNLYGNYQSSFRLGAGIAVHLK